MMYNLLYYQVVTQISCGLTAAERTRATEEAGSGMIDNLCGTLALINECLGQTDLYMEDDGPSTSRAPRLNLVSLEQQVRYFTLFCDRK